MISQIDPHSEMIAGAGERLRRSREAAGMSVTQVAERLHMPVRVVESLESEDWSRLGAPVFVRGQLRSYSRLLGLLTEPMLQASGVAPVSPFELTPRTYTPKAKLLAEQVARRLVYVVLTVVIALPVWLAMQPQFQGASRDAAPLDIAQPRLQNSVMTQPAPPLMASMTPISHRSVESDYEWVFRLTGESWIKITNAAGEVIQSNLFKAGEQTRVRLNAGAHVVVGNASAVQVLRNDRIQDLAAFQSANVARFTVSSDGTLAPTAD